MLTDGVLSNKMPTLDRTTITPRIVNTQIAKLINIPIEILEYPIEETFLVEGEEKELIEAYMNNLLDVYETGFSLVFKGNSRLGTFIGSQIIRLAFSKYFTAKRIDFTPFVDNNLYSDITEYLEADFLFIDNFGLGAPIKFLDYKQEKVFLEILSYRKTKNLPIILYTCFDEERINKKEYRHLFNFFDEDSSLGLYLDDEDSNIIISKKKENLKNKLMGIK